MPRDKRPEIERVPPDSRKIRWAPTMQPSRLKRLYDSDARGIKDDELCADVGFRLYARCETFVMVARGEVECPACGAVFEVKLSGVTLCPSQRCDWRTNASTWWQSIANNYAWPGRAGAVFAAFVAAWPKARNYGERMVAIDQLIHGYHHNAAGGPGKSVASKLLEGNKKAVVMFLDELSDRDPSAKAEWRRHVFQNLR